MLLLMLALLLLRLGILLAAKHLHHTIHADYDLSGVLLHSRIVSPFAGTQLAFDIDLCAFAEIFTCHLCQLPEQYYVMPFNRLAFLSCRLVIP